MLFSSATILSFSDTLPEHFDDLLANEAFEPCSAFSQSTFGWVSPCPTASRILLVDLATGFYFVENAKKK